MLAERHRAGILRKGINTCNKKSREPERPVASVRSVQDVTDRPRNEVIVVEHYCFFINYCWSPLLPGHSWVAEINTFLYI